MRLDHLLSREKAKVETQRLIPRSIPQHLWLWSFKNSMRVQVSMRDTHAVSVSSVSFSGFDEPERAVIQASPGSKPEREGMRDGSWGAGDHPLLYLDNCI